MEKKGVEKGELALLGVFAVFVLLYLWDIRSLPMEGKMLSYLAAPFILITMLLSVRSALEGQKKKKRGAGEEKAGEGGNVQSSATWRFCMTIGAGLFMFVGIYLVGFYLGSGLMMLVWFAAFRKLNVGSISLSLGIPLALFLVFEKLLDVGLPAGELFGWLGF